MYESTRKKFSVNKLLRNAVVCNMIWVILKEYQQQ
jgi:hypothetical protein